MSKTPTGDRQETDRRQTGDRQETDRRQTGDRQEPTKTDWAGISARVESRCSYSLKETVTGETVLFGGIGGNLVSFIAHNLQVSVKSI